VAADNTDSSRPGLSARSSENRGRAISARRGGKA